MDYLVGTMVTLTSRYIDDSPAFEKILHDEIKSKFVAIREMRKKGQLS
jgi:hypothetical protein